MRTAYIIICFALGAVGAYFGTPLISDKAIEILVTVYTVFAGFLVAVITILGDPLLLPSGSWRDAENYKNQIEARLIRHAWLFGLYLVTIGIIFLSVLLNHEPPETPECLRTWIMRIYLWLGIAAFLLSLALPKMLIDMQRARIDAEIKRRRKEAGIND